MSLEENWISLNKLAHKTVKALDKRNATHAEAFFTSTRTIEVVIRNSEILTQNQADDSGVGFRVAIGNKVGFACTNTLSEEAILKAGEKAFSIAKVSSEVPSFALPKAGQPPKAEGLFDAKIAETTVEETINIAEAAMRSAENFDKRVTVKDGRAFFQFGWRGVANNSGVDFEEKESRAVLYIGGSGEEGGEVTGSCADFAFSRRADLKPEVVGESVGRMVVGLLNPKPLKSFEGTVVFGPEAVSYQLVEVLIGALKGEAVASGRSAWAGKLGEKVASENFTVIDDAVLENGFSSRSFDDEGCPSQRTVLISHGKLEGFLHNATSANALKAKNTGNASRFAGGFDMTRWIIGNGYRAKPEVYPSNLVIQRGNRTKEELISEVKRGVLIESMAGFPQAGSGMISAQLSRAFYVEDGEIQDPIKGGMVSGVAFDWFRNVSGVGCDAKQFQNCVVPSLRVEGVKVVGA